MAKLIAISGAQSTGKTTLLNALTKKGYKVDSFKAARSVLEEFDLPLYEINHNAELTKKFQQRILEAKYQNDLSLKTDYKFREDDIIFVERSPVDIFAFAKVWGKSIKDEEFTHWVDYSFFQECRRLSVIYSGALVLPSGKFEHEYDGIRAKGDTQTDVEDWIRHVVSRTWRDLNFVEPKFFTKVIHSCDIIDRVKEVEIALEEAKAYWNSGASGFFKQIKE